MYHWVERVQNRKKFLFDLTLVNTNPIILIQSAILGLKNKILFAVFQGFNVRHRFAPASIFRKYG